MEVSGAPTVAATAAATNDDVLLRRPWLPVSISGCRLLAKIWFGDAAYHVLLTDMSCVWEERMDAAAIQSRAQELNRRLRAPVQAFFSHLREVAQPCLSGGGERAEGEARVSLTRRQEDGGVSVRLKSELAGLPFHWEFHCTPAPVTMVCAQLVRPLLAMSRLLQRQVEQLGVLLERKDAEIQDYRENGATLSRERLQTDVFDKHTYREDFMAKALPVVGCEQQDSLGFGADLQQLYAAVVAAAAVAHGNGRGRKRRLSEEQQEVKQEVEQEVEEEVEEGRPATEGPALSSSSSVGSGVGGGATAESGGGERRRADAAGPAAATARQQPPTVTADPAPRPSSKPKKKKVVGLFR